MNKAPVPKPVAKTPLENHIERQRMAEEKRLKDEANKEEQRLAELKARLAREQADNDAKRDQERLARMKQASKEETEREKVTLAREALEAAKEKADTKK